MTTPVELINLALKQVGVLGVGQTASPEDIADSFKMLNMMLAQWAVKRNVVHQILDIVPTSGEGEAYLDGPLPDDQVFEVGTGATPTGPTFTVGPGGDYNTQRPSKLVGAYARQLTPIPIDYPLEVLQSMTDYGRISTKTIASMPRVVYYDPQSPLGVLYVWPVMIPGYEIHLQMLAPLQRFETPYDVIDLPPEYEEAIMYNLAGRLYPLYGMAPVQTVIQLAAASLQTVRMANTQIGRLYMPADLVSGGTYNFYTDR